MGVGPGSSRRPNPAHPDRSGCIVDSQPAIGNASENQPISALAGGMCVALPRARVLSKSPAPQRYSHLGSAPSRSGSLGRRLQRVSEHDFRRAIRENRLSGPWPTVRRSPGGQWPHLFLCRDRPGSSRPREQVLQRTTSHDSLSWLGVGSRQKLAGQKRADQESVRPHAERVLTESE